MFLLLRNARNNRVFNETSKKGNNLKHLSFNLRKRTGREGTIEKGHLTQYHTSPRPELNMFQAALRECKIIDQHYAMSANHKTKSNTLRVFKTTKTGQFLVS